MELNYGDYIEDYVPTDSTPLIIRKHSNDEERTAWYKQEKLKQIAFIGVLMALYSVGEIGFALYADSLVMFSDGLHNLSDVLALAVAFWSEKVKNNIGSSKLTYGWRRVEVLGGLFNGLFLISLSVFVALQAIPNLIQPKQLDVSKHEGMYIVIVAGIGVAINILGVTCFSHAHSHGGGEDHGHCHGHGSKKVESKHHGHPHNGHHNGHAHSINDNHAHVHSVNEDDDQNNGHAHSHKSERTNHGHSHGHAHSNKTVKHNKHKGHKEHSDHHPHSGHEDEHAHAHGNKSESTNHGHSHGSKHDDCTEQADGHGINENHGHHPHSGHQDEHDVDHNIWGLVVHFLGDVFTSLLVAVVGLLYFLLDRESPKWHVKLLEYADPTTSILSVLIILVASWKLVKSCAWILMQTSPKHININMISRKICNLSGVLNIHELHVWQLAGSVSVATVHVVVYDIGNSNKHINDIRKIFHDEGVHSCTVQLERSPTQEEMEASSIPPETEGTCVIPGGHCVEDCEKDACCNPKVRRRRSAILQSVIIDPKV
eukprot:m.101275 g.101275  ORF g.101275 m.101275 type:complete len:541 (+) comp13737_c1_seq1:159-1781(+)